MKFFVKNEGLMIVVLLLLVTLGFQTWQALNQEKLATIDVQHLINQQAQNLAGRYPKGKVPEAKLQQLVGRLKNVVEVYAEKNNVILLSKNSVLGGKLPDYTQVILEKLKEENEENP